MKLKYFAPVLAILLHACAIQLPMSWPLHHRASRQPVPRRPILALSRPPPQLLQPQTRCLI